MRKLALLLALLLMAGPAFAQTTPAAPPGAATQGASRGEVSADEMELLRTLQGGRIEGRTTIPDTRSEVLIQPAGRAWREFHNVTLTWIGTIAICGMLAVCLIFYLVRGRIMIEEGPSELTIHRFDLLERSNHWMVASSFIVLGLTGLNITFGRYLLLPLIGPVWFTEISEWGKIAHNFLSFAFTLGIIVMFLLWVKDNIPNKRDIDWLLKGGGLIGRGHPEADRFNGGQKSLFWLTVLGGSAVATSGYFLIFPFWGGTGIAEMQLAHIVHSVLATLMVALIIGHIYIGTLGMEGAFEAMGSGDVDLNWAKEHHSLWVADVMEKGKAKLIPVGTRPAE